MVIEMTHTPLTETACSEFCQYQVLAFALEVLIELGVKCSKNLFDRPP